MTPMNHQRKKGVFNFAVDAAIGFATLGIVIVVLASMAASIQSQQTAGSAAFNAAGNVITGVNTFGQNLTTIALVVVLVIVIVLLSYLRSRGGAGGA